MRSWKLDIRDGTRPIRIGEIGVVLEDDGTLSIITREGPHDIWSAPETAQEVAP